MSPRHDTRHDTTPRTTSITFISLPCSNIILNGDILVTAYRLFTLADICRRHGKYVGDICLSPTSRRTVGRHSFTVDQSLQALQRSATPIRLARACSARLLRFDWQVDAEKICVGDTCRPQTSAYVNRMHPGCPGKWLLDECCLYKTKTKSPMASRLSHSPQRKGAALISVPRPWASSEPTLQPSG